MIPSARQSALKALEEVFGGGEKPREALDDASRALGARDRAFVMELVYGVIRHRETLKWILKDYLKRPPAPRTMLNLEAGAYQIFFMRVPEWAAVNEAVEAEKTHKGRPGLVNAVLRNAIRNREEKQKAMLSMREEALSGGPGAVFNISTLTSHPRWMVERWVKRFGPEGALGLAEANNRAPTLTLRVNAMRAAREEAMEMLRSRGIQCLPAKLSPQGINLLGRHSYESLREMEGFLTVQDEASQLIAYMLGPLPGERILDACAAPGGKTTHMAELMGDRGEILALEADERRMPRLMENVARLGLKSVKALRADAADPGDIGGFDRILLDAPCSATGVIRRRPDVKYRHGGAGDLGRFAEKQLGLLRAMSVRLRPGGAIVYSVCSTEPEEGEQVVEEFLKSSGDSFIIDASMPFEGEIFGGGFMRTYPHLNEMDGFFGAKICRRV